jgi:transcriptional regulator with XRE-family HTH domain
MAGSTRTAPSRTGSGVSVGPLLRSWRERRRLSQLDLSNRAAVSTRHLSYVETGRARPSRELLLHLAEMLDVPLREQNRMLLAAGHAPHFSERPVDAPELADVRRALDQVLEAHDPWPAVLVDGHWDVVGMNAGAWLFADGVDPWLLEPPINVIRLSLHPDGLARRVVNLGEFARHLVVRLQRQFDGTADPVLGQLLDEIEPWVPAGHGSHAGAPGVVLPVVLRSPVGELRLFSTIATFGAPLDATLSELALEAFYPSDAATSERIRTLRSRPN